MKGCPLRESIIGAAAGGIGHPRLAIGIVHLFCYEKKEEANGKAVVLHLYHYLRPEEKFEDVEELKCQIEEDIWEGKRHFLLTMESRRALLESETKKQKKN